ncbi:MAG: CBS domain-containing protein [Desulfopila sp.]|nr:CBS domain-containing protein [Desulfopila sp.]
MKDYRVKDLMVPISEYATVKVGTSLIDALLVLEKAQEAYTTSKYQHRAILVLDEDDKVVGKISQLRAIKAIEGQYCYTEELDQLRQFKFSNTYIARLRDSYRLNSEVVNTDTLKKIAAKKVEEFMQMPTPGEYIAEDSNLDMAIHRLAAETHLGLLVTRGEKIVGILRISDVFAAVFHEMTLATKEMSS